MPLASRTASTIAVFAAIACLLLTGLVWREVAASQTTWPFPALYFCELMALALGIAVVFLQVNPSRAAVAWVAGGVFAAFSVLAAWTMGLAYAPITLAFVSAALITDIREEKSLAKHLVLFAFAALAQTAIILSMVKLR